MYKVTQKCWSEVQLVSLEVVVQLYFSKCLKASGNRCKMCPISHKCDVGEMLISLSWSLEPAMDEAQVLDMGGQWYRRACCLLPSLCWYQFILLGDRCAQTTCPWSLHGIEPNALTIDHHATPEIDKLVKYILSPDLVYEITVLVRERRVSEPDETCNYLLFRMQRGLWRFTYASSSAMLLSLDFLAPSVYTSLWGMYYWVKIIFFLSNSSA